MEDLWLAWPDKGPWIYTRLPNGSNNAVRLVKSASGEEFVLKTYQNQPNISSIRFEHAVVLGLQELDLPFKVPVPIPTLTGETFLETIDEKGQPIKVCLWSKVQGEPFDKSNPQNWFIAGQTLAELHQGLSRLEIPSSPDCSLPVQFGDLSQIHPLVPNIQASLEQLALGEEYLERITKFVAKVAETVPDLYARLPQQIIHSDFGAYNLLMVGNRVSGVIDFEFTCYDIRGIDLVTLLLWSSVDLWGSGNEWGIVDIIGRGYSIKMGLDEREIKKLPELLRLLLAVGLIHRLGRWFQGLEKPEVAFDRVAWTLRCEDWLEQNGDRLINLGLGW
ncbi:MAG: hypothetical protein BGO39_18150 [Chloroflexi bacterium 54-19]|nr:MAG: hypothetical protein BGO39_18150 [Chloroflexi bacterium 54-19]